MKKQPQHRDHNVSFLLNESEYKVLVKYCSKYKIKNRSRFLRETVIKAVLTRLSDDYPTLFDEDEMR